MPYTIHTAKAKIRDAQDHYRDIDVFSDDLEGALEAIGRNNNQGARGAAVAAVQTIVDNINTNTANQLTDASAVANMIVQQFNAANTYKNGDYVRYTTTSNGTTINTLYRLTADHAANVTWANTSKVEVKLSNDVANLKSALYDYEINGGVLHELVLEHGKLETDGSIGVNPNGWITPDYIPTDDLLTVYNNTTNVVYIDYYNYENGEYIFVAPYVGIAAGSQATVRRDRGYLRLYSATGDHNKEFYLTRETGLVQQKYQLAILYNPSNEGVPNVDTTNMTLTIPKNTSIVWGNGLYLVPADVTIDYSSHSSTTVHKIVFNVKTQEFSIVNYNTFGDNTVAIAIISHNTQGFKSIGISCAYTVDGNMYNADKTNVFPLVYVSANGFPNIDTKNKTFTIPTGTTFYYGNNLRYETLSNVALNLFDDVPQYANALAVIFNRNTKTFSMSTYAFSLKNNELPIALIYAQRNHNNRICAVNGACPITVDGVVFGSETYHVHAKASENGNFHPAFEIGNFGETNGADSDASNRARTDFIEVVPTKTSIIVRPVRDDLQFWYLILDEKQIKIATGDSTYWSVKVPMSGVEIPVNQGYYIRICVKRYDNAAITETDIEDIHRSFSVVPSGKETIYTGDITDKVEVINGYYLGNNGALFSTSTASTTMLIPAVPGHIVEAKMRTNGGTRWMAFGLYDKHGTFIRRISTSEIWNEPTEDGDVQTLYLYATIPNNGSIGYVRFSFGANHIDYTITQNERKIPQPSYNVKSVNHRGFQLYAPENTLEAFKLSKAVGFDWIESDVQFTSDHVPVIIHDSTINRTAVNADGTAISTPDLAINSLTYDQASEYDYGRFLSPYYSGTKLPTFEEALVLCKNIGLKFRIELKSETVTTNNIASVIAIVEKHGMRHNVELASFNRGLIDHIVANYPEYEVGYISSAIDSELISKITAAQNALKRPVTCAVAQNNSAADFESLAATGCIIDIYTVVPDTNILNADTHVSSFTTNYAIAGEVLYKSVMG